MAAHNRRNLWLECAKRGIGDDPLIKTALQQLLMNPNDQECQYLIADAIHGHDVREMLHPEPFRRSNPGQGSIITGPIRLGVVNHTAVEWGISPDMLTKMVVLLGRAGGGKTTVIKAIIRGLLERRST